ncbi:MAG: HlyD family efflux transporter periplasmic adaptor subunit [Burkholderiaceae bacterium]|nr:MAG: HlyD family efflux transporter periplasmic adaptor subunit [Burkholderiaceae bacterium]
MRDELDSPEKINEAFEDVLIEKRYKTLAFWVLIIFFGGFLLWAATVPLDEGVPTMGKVVVDTKRKEIQHFSGGTLNEIYVKEGEFVEKDQPLIRLSDAKAQSEVIIEKNNISSINEGINVKTTAIKKNNDLASGAKIQLTLVMEELTGIRPLVEEGYVPKIRQIALEKEAAQLRTQINDLANINEQTMQGIEELKFRLQGAKERLAISERALTGKLIKAPVSGQVIGLEKQSVGSVITPAEKIMDIVPADELLLIEAEIKPNLIDRISVGDDVDIRFTTFSLTPFLVVSGEIVTISSDILMTQKREPYYLARVKVTDAGFEKLGNRKLRPGMEVGVVIKTGSRTLLTYLLHPLTRRIAFSLKEE